VRVFEWIQEDGAWRLWRYFPAERELADDLSTASSAADRRRLMDTRTDLVDLSLDRLLCNSAKQEANAGRHDEANRRAALMLEVASAIGGSQAMARYYLCLGDIDGVEGKDQASADDSAEALKLAKQAGDRALEARARCAAAIKAPNADAG